DEERIQTFLCDSADRTQLGRTVLSHLQLPLDVVIDTGLPLPDHQIATLSNLFPLLRSGGIYIIEDVIAGTAETLLAALSGLSAMRVLVHSYHPESDPDCVALAAKKS